jgi:hypothetical protein
MTNENLDPNKKSLSSFSDDAISGSQIKGGDGGPMDPLGDDNILPTPGDPMAGGPGPFGQGADPLGGMGGQSPLDPFNNPTDPMNPEGHVGPDPLGRPIHP